MEKKRSRFRVRKRFRVKIISWQKAISLAEKLAALVEKTYSPEVILAVGRGGLIPGRIISDRLLQRNLSTFRVQHYWISAGRPLKIGVTEPIKVSVKGKRVLLVDDITDTGETLKTAYSYVKRLKPAELKTAVLEHKATSTFKPDFFVSYIRRWHWVTYPWAYYEDLVDLTRRIYKDGMTLSEIAKKLKANFRFQARKDDLAKVLKEITKKKLAKK